MMRIVKILLILLIAFFPHLLIAADGDLDVTFGSAGKVTTDFSISGDGGYGIAIQVDGKILIVGSSQGSSLDFALARYNSDGTLDPGFGTAGKVTTDFFGGDDEVRAVAVQPDGKIIVAGYATASAQTDFALARYNADGTLDTTFGALGKVITDFSGEDDEAYALKIQNDSKIVVAGEASMSTDDFALVRYHPTGALDKSFGNSGKVTTDFSSRKDEAHAITLQLDGKIVAAGRSGQDLTADFAVARYKANGALDNAFSADGRVMKDIGGDEDEANDVELQEDGKIVVGGKAKVGTDFEFALVRYDSGGSLDPTFGTGGVVTTDFSGDDDEIYAIEMQSDDKILAAGEAKFFGEDDFALVRYNPDGSLDMSFGTGGIVITDFSSDHDDAYGLELQGEDRILAGGTATIAGNPQMAVARYTVTTAGSGPSIFHDDFEDGVLAANWNYPKGVWQESAGVLTGTAPRKAVAIASPAFAGSVQGSVEARIQTAGGAGNRVWLLGWYVDNGNYVELLMKEETDRWILKQHSGGKIVAKARGVRTIVPGIFYKAEIQLESSTFKVKIDGALLFTMRQAAAITIPGTVGFETKNTVGTFDEIDVH